MRGLLCLATDQGALYDGDRCWIRVVAEESEAWCELTLHLDCEAPPIQPDHWLSFELEALPFMEVMGLESDDLEALLFEHGIAPGQPFVIEAQYLSFQDWESGCWESEVDWEVARVQPWPADRAVAAWEAFYGRKHLIGSVVD